MRASLMKAISVLGSTARSHPDPAIGPGVPDRFALFLTRAKPALLSEQIAATSPKCALAAPPAQSRAAARAPSQLDAWSLRSARRRLSCSRTSLALHPPEQRRAV